MTDYLPPPRSLADRVRDEPIRLGSRGPTGPENMPADIPPRSRRLRPHWPPEITPAMPELFIAHTGRFTWRAHVVEAFLAGMPSSYGWTRGRAVAKALRQYDRWNRNAVNRAIDTRLQEVATIIRSLGGDFR